ncbi:hypothetical protein [Oscillibacter sp. GMB15532]|uniref:hypothetical protein n=1 Tax=Oscillibacter sp. GMB15532 TaxID=3230022 RepID=UPI0034DDF4B4
MIKDEIYSSIFLNATVFLNSSIKSVNSGLNYYKNKVLSIVNLQMALELAIKAKIVSDYGVVNILQNVNSDITDNELEEMYYSNKLIVREFDNLKNFLKSKNRFNFDKPEYLYIERFQKWRNKLVHFNYSFSDEENSQIEKDIIHVLVYILGVLMSDDVNDDDRTYMQDHIDMDEYGKLMKNAIYFDTLSDMIDSEYGDPYYCPICDRKLLTPNKKCLGCLLSFKDSPCYGFVKCTYCHEDMVIYDKANIKYNKNMIRGLCLYCKNYTTVYECPKCGIAVNMESFDKTDCSPEYCKWRE